MPERLELVRRDLLRFARLGVRRRSRLSVSEQSRGDHRIRTSARHSRRHVFAARLLGRALPQPAVVSGTRCMGDARARATRARRPPARRTRGADGAAPRGDAGAASIAGDAGSARTAAAAADESIVAATTIAAADAIPIADAALRTSCARAVGTP